jgi:hypothetical protein
MGEGLYHLPPWGYLLVDLDLDDSVLRAALEEAKRKVYVPVFHEVGGDTDDEYRRQSWFDCRSAATKSIKAHLTAIRNCIDTNWKPDVFSFMLSLSGGPEQEPRQDFTVDDRARADDLAKRSISSPLRSKRTA